jgi:hypothetical protein
MLPLGTPGGETLLLFGLVPMATDQMPLQPYVSLGKTALEDKGDFRGCEMGSNPTPSTNRRNDQAWVSPGTRERREGKHQQPVSKEPPPASPKTPRSEPFVVCDDILSTFSRIPTPSGALST